MSSPVIIQEWPQSLKLWERSKKSLAGGVSTGLRASMPPHPLSFVSGQGSQITDVDGNTYTDYVLGWGPLFLGHSHPKVLEEVGRQLPLGQTFGSGHRYEYEAAELVLELVPGVERVLWSNTGTEANQSAFRLARAATGRQKIVKLSGHYHGWMDNVLVNYRGDDVELGPKPSPGTKGYSKGALDDVLVARFNEIESLRALLKDPRNDIAAVILEVVSHNSGVLLPEPGFLEELRKLTSETGTILIFDEVISGFRIALGGASEYFGVKPDLHVFAKGIASGFSLAAIAGKAEIIDQVNSGVVHAGTYNGNPIALAAAYATLTHLKQTRPHAELSLRASRLAEGHNRIMAEHGVTGFSHSVGPTVQLALGVNELRNLTDYLNADWGQYDKLILELLRRGEFILPGGRWYLSTEHSDSDIERTLSRFQDAIAVIKNDKD